MQVRTTGLTLIVAVIGWRSAYAGQVNCRQSWCQAPPEICYTEKCGFSDIIQYTWNEVRKSFENKDVIDAVVKEVQRKNTAQFYPRENRIPNWWRDAFRVKPDSVVQSVNLEPLTILRSAKLIPSRSTIYYSNCGNLPRPEQGKITESAKNELETFVKDTLRRTLTFDVSYSTGASIAGFSANLAAKLNESIEENHEESVRRTETVLRQIETFVTPAMQKHSITTVDVTVPKSQVTYQFAGSVVTDAVIVIPPWYMAKDYYVGKWSDFVPEAVRTARVTGTTVAEDGYATFGTNEHEYPTEEKCLDAFTKLQGFKVSP